MEGSGPTDPEPTGATASAPSERELRRALQRGASIGRYVVVDPLGQGGMGVVYKAFDPELGRPVAVKLITTDEGRTGVAHDRLLREAQALAQLAHPNVVAVHDVGTFGDDVFVAMEFVEGETLKQWLKAPRRLGEVIEVFLAAGEGLAAAHRAGLVHRDFKPDNVIVGNDGRVRVLDFGLARVALREQGAAPALPRREPKAGELDETSAARRGPKTHERRRDLDETPSSDSLGSSASRDRLHSSLTQAGSIMGTPRFMAPEQHLGQTADERADQFSFCVSLYWALYREFPFAGETADEYSDNVVDGKLRPVPSGRGVPRWLQRALLRGLAVAPADRHPSMTELLALLRRSSERARARRLAVGVACVMALGIATWGWLGWRARALERAELCAGAPRRLAGIWDEATKGRVHAALLATGRPYAKDAWKNVEATLDKYAARWSAMHRDSCEATRVRGEQTEQTMTLRMACLDRKLQGLSALVDVFAQADSEVLEKASSAAAGLGSLEICTDVASLTAEVPPPTDPVLRRVVGEVRARISRAEALRLAGRLPDGAKVADQSVVEARKSGDAPVLAEALAKAGLLQSQLDPEKAASVLREAYWLAFANRLDHLAIDVAIQLMHANVISSHFDEATSWEQHAQAGLQRIAGDDELESDLWSIRMIRDSERGKYDDALAAASRAARLGERRFGPDDLRVIRLRLNELVGLSNVRRRPEAAKLGAQLLARLETLLGPHHPVVAHSLMDLADDELQIGHLADARTHLQRAEQIYREAGDTDSRYFVALLDYSSGLALAQGRFADALANAKEAYAILERRSLMQSEMALSIRLDLGLAQASLGRLAEARGTLEQAIAESERAVGKDSLTITPLLSALADVHRQGRELGKARAVVEREVAITRAQSGEGSADTATAYIDLARVLLAQGHAAEALELVVANEPVILRGYGEDAGSVAAARKVRADALARLGRTDEALTALQSSLALAERIGTDPVERRKMAAEIDRLRAKKPAR
jgi:serine/threonine protein kinase/tetratricopeptide (TPR) repeat protein